MTNKADKTSRAPAARSYQVLLSVTSAIHGRRLSNHAWEVRPAFTLMEILIAMTIMVILVTMSAPMYNQAVEQARLDTAARNLRTIWAAQRIYWLEEHDFADRLTTLQTMDLVSPKLALSQKSSSAFYMYRIDEADSGSFSASVMRNGSRRWSGTIRVDELGDISGCITNADGTRLSPMLGQ